jgi:DNA repair protein RecO (recombination protein O)
MMRPRSAPLAMSNAASDTAFVLHTIAWRETSLIVEIFTRDHGRLGLIARGARRPRSALRGLLQPFQPLFLRWSGKSELRNLIGAEWMGGMAALSGMSLMPGFYLNELMVRLIPREDAHPALFEDYLSTLAILAKPETGKDMTEPILRRFECNLLREMGYSPVFDRDSVSGQAVAAAGVYRVNAERGVTPAQPDDLDQDPDVVHGRTLLCLAQAQSSIEEVVQSMEDPEIAVESKRLLRRLLGHHLGETALQSREVMREIQRI